MSTSGRRRKASPAARDAAEPSRRSPVIKKTVRTKKTQKHAAVPAAAHRRKSLPRPVRGTAVTPARARLRPRTPAEVIDALESALADGGLAAWLSAEKARRGLAPEQLVFVGTHNIAQQVWCPMMAVLKSRAEELTFFREYLENRVRWAAAAQHVRRLPRSVDEWLAIGDDLTLDEVLALHAIEGAADAEDTARFAKNGLTLRRVARVGDGEMDRFAIGHALEAQHAEVHTRVQWHFAWGPYEIVAAPDGLADTFVYEFKTGARRHFLPLSKATAFAQADLYGVFFRRATKRVQLLVREDDRIERWHEPVDPSNAERLLRTFQAVVGGTRPAPPPPWACRNCDVRRRCPLVGYTPPLPFDTVPGRSAEAPTAPVDARRPRNRVPISR